MMTQNERWMRKYNEVKDFKEDQGSSEDQGTVL